MCGAVRIGTRPWLVCVSLWLGTLLSCLEGADRVLAGPSSGVITNISQFYRGTDPGQGANPSVQLEGVVCWANRSNGELILQDETGAILVEAGWRGRAYRAGQRVVIRGDWSLIQKRLRQSALVENDGLHSALEQSGALFLKAGRHPIIVGWFDAAGEYSLEVSYQGPGLPRQTIPDSALFRAVVDAASGATNWVNGLEYRGYEGRWKHLPDFSRLRPVKSGTVANFDIGVKSRTNYVGLEFTGFIELPSDGAYTFYTKSDDGSRLWIETSSRDRGLVQAVSSTGVTTNTDGPRLSARQLVPGQILPPGDAPQWSVTEGIATFIRKDSGLWEIELTANSGSIQIECPDALDECTALLSQSRIRAAGISETLLTSDGRVAAGKLVVPGFDQIELVWAAPQFWGLYPIQTIADAAANIPQTNAVRHPKGTARIDAASHSLWLRDDTGEVLVRTAQELPKTNGGLIEALGFLRQRGRSLVLEKAVYRPWMESTNSTGPLPLLTKVEEVHRLSPDEAEKKYPLKVRGVITCLGEGARVLQDETRGIWFDVSAGVELPPLWELVEMEGVSGPGDFAPVMTISRIERLGGGKPPEPARPSWDLLLNGAMDCQYVELQGVVSQVQSNDVVLLINGGELKVDVDLREQELKPYLNSLVRLRGVLCAQWSPQTHQVIVGQVRMEGTQIHRDDAAPADFFAIPLKRIPDLWLFSLQSSVLRRVKVAGQFLCRHDREFYLQDQTNGLRFILKEPAILKPGDRIEVVGYPELGGPSPLLKAATVRTIGSAPLPVPATPSADYLLNSSLDATLIQLESHLAGLYRHRGDLVMEMHCGSRIYQARMPMNEKDHLDLPVGSRVRLTGVCAGKGGRRSAGRDNDSMELLVSSPKDIVILARPSRWTIGHALGVLAVLAVVLLMAGGWIYSLRGQVDRRTRQLREEIEERKQIEVDLLDNKMRLESEIEERERLEKEKERIHKKLVDASRQAGMAEVATSVLHNVGNVLNSVNVSAGLIRRLIRESTGPRVSKLAALLDEHRGDLAGFLTQGGRGGKVITHLQSLGQGLISEQAAVLREVEGLSGNIGHIKEIVARQQSYAKVSNVLEVQSVPALLEDALQLSADMLARHQIQVARQFDDVPEVLVDKHKVLEILVNLVSNAKQAMSSNAAGERRLTLRVGGQPGDLVGISVADNGIGIPPENLTSIFSHGFTTKKDGHGFGLHSAAIFAREMGGSLRVHSDGPGKGARFTLELPVRPPEAASTPDTRHPTLGLESIIARPQ